MDTDPAPGPRVPGGITAATTLGEIAGLVGGRDTLPVGERLAIETVDPGRINSDLAIAAGVRARRAPYVAAAATGLTGWAAWGCVEMAAAVGGPTAHTAVVGGTWAATALALPVLRVIYRNQIPDAWRRRWWLSGVAAAAWIDVAAATTPATWVMTGALTLGSVALSARWAAEHEVLNPGAVMLPSAPTPPPHPAIDSSRAAQLEQAWHARVTAGRSPVAAGSRLTGRTDLPNGTQWIVELDPEGSVGCTELIQRSGQLARALQVNPAHVILERLDGENDREDRAQVTVVTRDLLAGGVPYQGPRYCDGRIRIGLYADGAGEPEWVAYDNTGVRGGLVAGGQGSGKSAFLAMLAMAYKASAEWIVLFGDGDDLGNSSALLREIAHDAAKGPDEVLEQLEALEAWYRIRGLFMPTLTRGPDGKPVQITDRATQAPVEQIEPCPAYPGHVWILDELHRLAGNQKLKDAKFIPRAAQLLRIMRKYGGTIIVGTQSLLAEDFGGDTAFRGMLAQGNLIALRSKNKSERYIVSDFGFAPSTLPKGGGYGFSDDGVRRAMLRVEWAPAAEMRRWAAGLPHIEADHRSALAYARHRSPLKLDPVADYNERLRELAEYDTALASGAPLPGSAAEPAPKAAPVSVGGVSVPAPLGGKVIRMRPRPDVQPAPVPPQPGELSPKAAQVLAVLRSKPKAWKSAELIEATRLAGPDVSKALNVLVSRGLAHRPTSVQGVHSATPAVTEETSWRSR